MPRELWRDPYAAQTIDLLREPARARAAAVRQVANAQARAAEAAGSATANAQIQSGNAWAGGIQQAGQAIAAIPGQMAQAQEQSRAAAMQRLQLKNVEGQIRDRDAQTQQRLLSQKTSAAVDEIMSKSLKEDAQTGVFTFDRPTFEQGLIKSGNGHLYPSLAETLDKLDASASKRNAEGRVMLADTLIGIEKAGYTPEAVFSGAAYLKANRVVTSDRLQPVLDAIASDPSPDNVKTILGRLGNALPEYGARREAEEKRTADLAKTKAEAAKIDAEGRVSAAEAANLATVGRKEVPAPVKETRTIDVQAAEALAKGDTARYRQLVQAKRDLDTSPATERAGLWIIRDGKTLRVKESEIRPGDEPASTREQGRRVTSGDAGRFAELQTSLDDLDKLGNVLGTTGAASKVGAMLPNVVTEMTGWGTDAKSRQGTIDRVKQVIGKALEGGVLRKEDEEKYKAILPTIGDPPAVAKAKLDGLRAAIQQRLDREIDAREDAGYDVTKFRTRQEAPAAAPKKLRYNQSTGKVE